MGRQWCGRLGKVENCQVGIYMGYVTRMAMRWSMCVFIFPKTGRRTERVAAEAGIPKTIKFQTRHQLALEMLGVRRRPPAHLGRGRRRDGTSQQFSAEFAFPGRTLSACGPSNTLIRDIDVPLPEYSGRGRHPKNPFMRVNDWCSMLLEDAWTKIDVRDGEKGPLVIEMGEVSCSSPNRHGWHRA